MSAPERQCAHRSRTCRSPAAWLVEMDTSRSRRERWLCEDHAKAALLDECADAACHNEDGDRYVVGADGQLVEAA